MELQKIVLKEYDQKGFKWMAHTWAGFNICPIIENNKIVRVYIYPVHQPDATIYYEISNEDGWDGFDFGCFLKDDTKLSFPQVQETFFCKEHNSHSFYFLVPEKSSMFFINTGLEKFCINWR